MDHEIRSSKDIFFLMLIQRSREPLWKNTIGGERCDQSGRSLRKYVYCAYRVLHTHNWSIIKFHAEDR